MAPFKITIVHDGVEMQHLNKKLTGALDDAPFEIITALYGAEKSAHDG